MAKHLVFLSFLYFAQGIPYGLQSRFLPTYFRSHGMSLSNVGFFKLLLAPWMMKALWAPLVDKYGTKKLWLIASMLGLVVTCCVAALVNTGNLFHLAVVLFAFNLLTSTQDIAVDGIAISILSASELGYGNIAQVVGYKFGAIFGGGLLTTIMDYISWMSVFQCLAIVYVVAVVVILRYLPNVTQEKITGPTSKKNIQEDQTENSFNSGKERSWIKTHYYEVVNTEGTWWIITFVLIYKLGEQGTLSMTPLFLIDQGISTSTIGFWLGINGQIISILGSVIGGWCLSYLRLPIIHSLKLTICARIILVAVQCSVVLFWQPIETIFGSGFNLAAAVVCMFLLLLISGIITTLTFTLMMQCSQKAPVDVQATHYTTLATFEVLGKLTFSVMAGVLTDMVGYSTVFLLFVFLSIIVLPVLSSESSTRT